MGNPFADVLVTTGRFVLLGVFLAAFLGKVRSRGAFAEFTRATARMAAVPARWVPPLAATVVCAEAAVVVGLALPGRAGPGAAALLLLAMTAAVAAAVARGEREPCRCLGSGDAAPGAWQLVRNVGLVLVAVAVVVANPSFPGPLALVVSGLLALLVVVVVLAAEELRGTPAPRQDPG